MGEAGMGAYCRRFDAGHFILMEVAKTVQALLPGFLLTEVVRGSSFGMRIHPYSGVFIKPLAGVKLVDPGLKFKVCIIPAQVVSVSGA